jgi:SAM-dependent methyltransferase
MKNEKIKSEILHYFGKKYHEYGLTPKGADWNGSEAQIIRYMQIIKLFSGDGFSVLDYGCSYGAFSKFLFEKYPDAQYVGYDILEEVIEAATVENATDTRVSFLSQRNNGEQYDYVIASGTFNYMGHAAYDEWESAVLLELTEMFETSRRGIASNFLTKYSDEEKMKSYLYYADPTVLFDFCKNKMSRNVSILHDYDLYDFTLIVRK